MNRISQTFKALKRKNRKAFIPYITAGDPDMETTAKIVSVLIGAGADIVELGIPFSEALADGPVIQRAIERSLKAGISIKKIFALVKRLRRKIDIPIVFMTYYNIIFNYGVARFVKDAKISGADGVIVPDLPMEEALDLKKAASIEDFYVIMLAAPTTSLDRFKKISRYSKGFIYYVSLTGVTGARKELPRELKERLLKFKGVTRKPVCVGFGVSNSKAAKLIKSAADGVIVGSAIIDRIEKNLSNKDKMTESVKKFAQGLAKAIHQS